jgi:hypothetical protein
MNNTSVVVKGIVKEDGTLELREKVNLPPGPVQVTVQAAPQATAQVEDLMTFMERIWAGQRARGFVPRSVEEVEAERRAMREEADERLDKLETIQEESRRLREERQTGEK